MTLSPSCSPGSLPRFGKDTRQFFADFGTAFFSNPKAYIKLHFPKTYAILQLAAQQTKADQKPIEEVKAKAEAGDAESQVELGRRYDERRRRGEGSGGGGEVVSQSRRTEFRRGAIQSGPLLLHKAKAWRRIQWRR